MTGRHEGPRRQRRSQRRVTEASEYVAFLLRLLDCWGDRIAADPAVLTHSGELAQRLVEATNRGIFEANRGAAHYSQRDIAAILGISQPAVFKRARAGELAYAERQAAMGAGPLVRLADVRASRAAGLAAAGVADVTGSERERAAGQ